MWKRSAFSDLKKSFDDAISSAYGNGSTDELSNLARLFSDAAMRNYERGLNGALDDDSAASVGLGWIDKRPIAKLTADGPGAELGDMILVVEEFDPNGLVSTRACIVEVKQSPFSSIPPVPVTPSSKSTRNQLRILSEWPTIHGLLATGSNKSYLLENIVTQPGPKNGGVLTQAWYAAVRARSPGVVTPDPWMVAPAIEGADFRHTLGDLFAACATRRPLKGPDSGPVGVGREVNLSRVSAPPGWSELVEAIILVARSHRPPPKHFGKEKTDRYWRTFANACKREHMLVAMPFAVGIWDTALGTAVGIVLAAIVLATALWLMTAVGNLWMSARAARRASRTRGVTGVEADVAEGKVPVVYLSIYHGQQYEQQEFVDD